MKFLCYLFISLSLLSTLFSDETPPQCQRFFIVSPPKCGTFLIGKTMTLITQKEGHYVLGEFGTQDQTIDTVEGQNVDNRFVIGHNFSKGGIDQLVSRGYKVIYIYRDPRDQLISIMNWMREGEWGWLPVSKIQDVTAQVEELITGKKYGYKAYEFEFLKFEQKVASVPSQRIFFTRFENLVGAQGGGTEQKQINEILNLASFVGIDLDYEGAKDIAERVFGDTITFRSGKIGAWKKYFNTKLKTLYKTNYQKELKRLGYEKNNQW